MAVTRKGTTITFTADADAATGAFLVAGVTFHCDGSVAGNRLRVTDTGGDVICDYLVEAATIDNADLWGGRTSKWYHGILIEDFPTGTGVLTVFLE